MAHFVVYVRRSYRATGDADVSDEIQVERSVAMLPRGATHEVISDSGGHHSGRTDDRDGLRELVERIRDRRCDGIAVYDVSRLFRNARLLLELHHAIEQAGLPLLVATAPDSRWDTAVGRFMLAQLAVAAQFQADMDSERAIGIRRSLFEDGRHRGHPPFGYRNGRDDDNRRTLVVDPTAAAVVERIFVEAAARSLTEIADGLTLDGLPAPTAQGWTRYVVREIVTRAKVYQGLVVSGTEERPGRHAPIITPELAAGALVGMRSRDRGGRRAGPGRTYLLSGVLACDCGRPMTGQLANRRPKRYYACRYCRRPMVKAGPLEARVVDAIRMYRLPRATVDAAREDLRRRLAIPGDDGVERHRRRLEGRLANLRKQHGWGDIDDAAYRRDVAETEAMLANLPDRDKVVAFDRIRATVVDMADAIDGMEPDELKRAVRLFVEEVTPAGVIRWAAPVRPFFALAVGVDTVSPEGSESAETTPDPLEWFVAASSA